MKNSYIHVIVYCTALISSASLFSMKLDCRNFDHLIANQARFLTNLVRTEQNGHYCADLDRAIAVLSYNQDIVFDDNFFGVRGWDEEKIKFVRKITRRNVHCKRLIDFFCNQEQYAEGLIEQCKNNQYAANAQLLRCDYGGVTPPLHYALWLYGCEHNADKKKSIDRCIRHLIKSGANVNSIDYKNRIPLHVAPSIQHIELLIAQKSRLNARNEHCMTPLNYHIKKRRIDCAQFLLDNGADHCVKDSLGNTPLHHAVQARNCQLISVLLNKTAGRADFFGFNAENKFYETPAHIAFYSCGTCINQLIRAHMMTYLGRQMRNKNFQAIKRFIEKYPLIGYKNLFFDIKACYSTQDEKRTTYDPFDCMIYCLEWNGIEYDVTVPQELLSQFVQYAKNSVGQIRYDAEQHMIHFLFQQLRSDKYMNVIRFIKEYSWLNYKPLYNWMKDCYPQEITNPHHIFCYCIAVLKSGRLINDGNMQEPKKKRIKVA